MTLAPTRRRRFIAAIGGLLLASCASVPPLAVAPPIVFVHGNGDSAALWQTTLWRFESNGWPRERLRAIDLPFPLARDDDERAQPGRSSSTEHMQLLAAEVDRLLQSTGAAKVVLIGNSRGGIAIRNYIAHGGGRAKVSHAVLGGTPNHGVWSHPGFLPRSEFNGAGPVLTALNHQGGAGVEITPGVQWLTVRSDRNDKFAQPDGVWIGQRGTATHVGFDSPELKGAKNVVLADIDHRETSFSAAAFAIAHDFIVGRAPATPLIVPQWRAVLDGQVSGLGLDNQPGSGNFVNNLPLAGATVEVYATDPVTGERRGAPLHRRSVGADGRWGPFSADPGVSHEFVVSAPGFATTHIYRSPFPRSSDIVHLRATRLADADRAAKAVVALVRPRGYFGVPRDRISLDGVSPPAGIPSGTAGVAEARLRLPDATARAVAGEFNGERIVGRSWPTADNHLVLLELHH